MPTPPVSPAAIALLAAIAAPVHAGSPTAGPRQHRQPVALEQGVEDVGPLSVSHAVPPHDLRLAAGFDKVYRVPGDDGRFMRIDGAIAAVFPESEYIPTPWGLYTPVPAGTIWMIGVPGETPGVPASRSRKPASDAEPIAHSEQRTQRAESSGRPVSAPLAVGVSRPVATRIQGAADGRPSAPPARTLPKDAQPPDQAATTPAPDMADEAYRAGRLREISERLGPR